MKCRIAVVQCKIEQYAPGKNLQRAEQFIRKAAGKADIIVSRKIL